MGDEQQEEEHRYVECHHKSSAAPEDPPWPQRHRKSSLLLTSHVRTGFSLKREAMLLTCCSLTGTQKQRVWSAPPLTAHNVFNQTPKMGNKLICRDVARLPVWSASLFGYGRSCTAWSGSFCPQLRRQRLLAEALQRLRPVTLPGWDGAACDASRTGGKIRKSTSPVIQGWKNWQVPQTADSGFFLKTA